jgi:hypothetical protein
VGALARAVGEADKLLPALRRGADDDEDALRSINPWVCTAFKALFRSALGP